MKFEAILGFHGVVVRVDDLREAERLWRDALGIRVLRRTRSSVTLGEGPEFFVTLRRGEGAAGPCLEEIHVAVRGLTKRVGRPDALGGRSVERGVSGPTLCVREFRSAPGPPWRPPKPSPRRRRSRRGGTARRPASRRAGR